MAELGDVRPDGGGVRVAADARGKGGDSRAPPRVAGHKSAEGTETHFWRPIGVYDVDGGPRWSDSCSSSRSASDESAGRMNPCAERRWASKVNWFMSRRCGWSVSRGSSGNISRLTDAALSLAPASRSWSPAGF